VALAEGHAFANQSIHVRRIDKWKSQRVDGIVPLLIRNNENDIRLIPHAQTV
jgi:hypothetical protein